jgi:hypothetical protein
LENIRQTNSYGDVHLNKVMFFFLFYCVAFKSQFDFLVRFYP